MFSVCDRNAPILNKTAADQNSTDEKKHQSHRQRRQTPDKSHFFRIFWVVINFHFRIDRIFRFPRRSEIRLFGIAFAVNGVAHDRAIMGTLHATEKCTFFFQLYDGCIDRHGAFYVSHNLCHKQKQTDTGKNNADNEKECVTHDITPEMLLDAIKSSSVIIDFHLQILFGIHHRKTIHFDYTYINSGNNNCRDIVTDKFRGSN